LASIGTPIERQLGAQNVENPQVNVVVVDFSWKNQNVIKDTTELRTSKVVIDRLGLVFAPGDYRCQLSIRDINNSANADSAICSISLPAPQTGTPYLSDIEIASSIQSNPEAKISPFYKNTLLVTPNPSLIFSKENPALFFYAEAYNLPADELKEGYQLTYSITDLEKKPVEAVRAKAVRKSRVVHPSVEYGMIPVGQLSSGAYLLDVKILSLAQSVIAAQSRKFYVYQADSPVESAGLAQNEAQENIIFQQMDSVQVEQEFLRINYLSDKETRKVWSQVASLAAKRHFLAQFWIARDPSPGTPENELRKEFLARTEYANENFRTMKLDGWKTDRGRVYIVYGSPSDIERYPNEPNSYPFELWHYDALQNGTVFVFADFEGRRNYRLLHSNLLGELQNYNYMESIKKGF